MITKKRLFTPGPTPLYPEGATLDPSGLPHHRQDDFRMLLRECLTGLKTAYKTQQDVVLLTASGTGAMEAAVANLLSPQDPVLVLSAGKFGERWERLCAAYSLRATVLRRPYGESVAPDDVRRRLEVEPDCRAVLVQACESSTGAAHDLQSLGGLVSARPQTLLVVDAITGLGTMELQTDAWALDVVIGGSQKAFMAPPGLSFLSLSAKARAALDRSSAPRFYFDLRRELEQQARGQTAFTPAVPLVSALNRALSFINGLGIDALTANARNLAGMTRSAMEALNLPLFPQHPADAMTAVRPPAAVDTTVLVRALREEFGAIVSGGQGELKGKILRIAHLGYYDVMDLFGLLGCLEICLLRQGLQLQLGAGVRAAQQAYLQRESDAG